MTGAHAEFQRFVRVDGGAATQEGPRKDVEAIGKQQTMPISANEKDQLLSDQCNLSSQIGCVMTSLEQVRQELHELKSAGIAEEWTKLVEWRSRSENWTNEVQAIVEKLSAEKEQQSLNNMVLNDRLAGLEKLLGEHGAKHAREVQKQEECRATTQATLCSLQSAVVAGASGGVVDVAALMGEDSNEKLADRLTSLENLIGESAYKYAKDLQDVSEDTRVASEKHIMSIRDMMME